MLENLFSPIKINGRTVKNRMVVPAMVMNYCNEDGTCTERFSAYHENKARGGFGMIVTEDFAVCPEGKSFNYIPGLWDDRQIESFRDATSRVHKYGALFIAQIFHAGRQTSSAVIGRAPLAPSAVPCPFSPNDVPEEMSLAQIQEVISDFGDCARRAKEAGFDGVEIHGAHGYLISQFLSPYSNKRTDIYGGPLQNRMRFALEVIRDVREKCGSDFIVGFRISMDDAVTGGRTIEDTKTIVRYLEAAGVDYINATMGVYRSLGAMIPSMFTPHAWTAECARLIKDMVDIPVISVGRYNDPRIADTVIKAGDADMVAFGRQSLADPETPLKAKEGRFDDIVQCIGCHHGCVGNLLQGIPGKCMLNPLLGRESEIRIEKTDSPKKVLVIGAGPGGMEAAIYAARRGHHVAVYEKESMVGGTFRIAAVPPGKGEITTFLAWQRHTLEKLGVRIVLNTEVTPEMVKMLAPDVIIAANGASPVIPEQFRRVSTSTGSLAAGDIISEFRRTRLYRQLGNDANIVTANDVLAGRCTVGPHAVVVGGGDTGMETANHLAAYLHDVTVVEIKDDVAADEALVPRWDLLADAEKNKVKILTGTSVKEIREHSVVLEGKNAGEIPADTIVLAVGSRPDRKLGEDLKAAGYEVHVIGDAAKAPNNAWNAITEGFRVGLEI